MAKKKKEFTHIIVAVPREDGRYKNPDGQKVNLHKFPKENTVQTPHPKFEGTTITNFVKHSDFTKS